MSLNKVHDLIVTSVWDKYPDLKTFNKQELLRKLFFNYRKGSGLRLSKYGFQHCDMFESYVHNIAVNLNYLVKLEKVMTMPYYAENNKFYLFSEEDSFQLKLANNDLSRWIEMNE